VIPYADPDVLDDEDPPGETERPALRRLVAPLRPLAPKTTVPLPPPSPVLDSNEGACRTPRCGRDVPLGTVGVPVTPGLEGFCAVCRNTIHRSARLGYSLDEAIVRRLARTRPGASARPRGTAVPPAPKPKRERVPCRLPGCRTLAQRVTRRIEIVGLCAGHAACAKVRARKHGIPLALAVTQLSAALTERIDRKQTLREWARRGSHAAE